MLHPLRIRPPFRALFLVASVGAITACGDDDTDDMGAESDGSDGPDSQGTSTDGDTAGSASEGGTDGGGTTTGEEAGPTLIDVALVANPANFLSFTITAQTDVETTLSVTARSTDGHEVVATAATTALDHRLNLLGLRADRDYALEVVATDAMDRSDRDDSLTYTTDPLPPEFPPLQIERIDPDAMAPGFTFFDVTRWVDGALESDRGLALALDDEGEVVWFHRTDHRIGDLRRLSAGTLGYNYGNEGAVEIDAMGNTVSTWTAAGLDPATDTFHHEFFEREDGTFYTLSSELRTIDGYDDGMGGTVAHAVVADVIVQFDRAGSQLQTVSLFDALADHHLRVRPGFDATFWNARYADEAPEGTKDWTHGNAVVYDPDRDLVLVSARHQDWLVAVDASTGAFAWNLGPEGDFSLAEGEWFYHQHAPQILEDGSILLYDNGNGRPGTGFEDGDEAPFSRAVQFTLDTAGTPETWTATQTWSYGEGGTEPRFAPFVGDADRLPNGNVLITHGGLVGDGALPIQDPTNLKSVEILEVTGGTDPQPVFRVTVRDETPPPQDADDPAPVGYTVYRAERLPSLAAP